MDPEQIAYRLREQQREIAQRLFDRMLWGNKAARAALSERYRPIEQYQKEGPDVGQREQAESEAGRIN